MHKSDDRPSTSGRPSLLSPEQQAEVDRQRVSSSDGTSAARVAGVETPARRRRLWPIAAALVVAAGVALWFTLDAEPEFVAAVPAPAAAPAPVSAPASAAIAAADALPPKPDEVKPEAEEVSTAAILDDAPKAASEPEARPKGDELAKLLAPTAVAATPAPVIKKAPAKPAPVKLAHKKPAAKVAEAAPRKKPAAPPEAEPAFDNDVSLLAALIAHSKAQAKKAPASEKLRQCKTLGSVAEAEQCRAKLCAGSARNDAECKGPAVAKVAKAA
ncbi:MAG: hypothetical protein ABIT83_26115 [Massilia sp.]